MLENRLGGGYKSQFRITNVKGCLFEYAARTSAVFFGAFIVAMLAVSIFTPQQPTNADRIVTVTNSAGQSLVLTSAGTVTMSITPTAGGASASGMDTLNVKTNADGYQLYLSMNNDAEHGNRLYKDGDNTTTDYLSPVSGTFSTPDILQNNTWGFAIASDSGVFDSSYQTPTPASTSKWAAVPLRSNAQLIKSSNQEAPDPGDNIPVYYGVKATTALSSGIYSNTIAYTAVISGGSIQDIAAIAPERTDNLRGGETITISTSLSATAANVGIVSVKIGDQSCTDATASNSGSGQINITCKTPAMNTGKYDVTVEIPDYNKIYFIPEGFEYYVDTPGSIGDSLLAISNMQDMTPEICTNSVIGDENILIDTRDNKTYAVRKMEDGRCWMIQNLRLGDVGTSYVLTPDDTDITSNLTIESKVTVNTGTTSWGTDEYDTNTFHIYSNGNRWIQPTSSGSNSTVRTSGTPPSQAQYIGNYYNWYTATAGTGTYSTSGNAASSICPKGWKLPTGGASGEIANLTNILVNIATSASNVPTQSFTLQSAPNYFVLSGRYINGASFQGSEGYWWPRGAETGAYIYPLSLDATNIRLHNTDYNPKHYGYSVRCIADQGLFRGISTMQDMTSAICATATVGDEKILKDTRDNNTYIVRRMEDGKCWMTQNLRLGTNPDGIVIDSAITLTPADSDVTADFIIPDSAVQTSGNINWGPYSNEEAVNTVHVYSNGNAWIQPTSSGSNSTVRTSGTPPSQAQYIGNYYNWYTATAGTGTYSTSGNAASSICPKGWRLPRLNTSPTELQSFTSALVQILEDTDYVPTLSFIMQTAPNHFVLSGFYKGGVGDQGRYGYWWSAAGVNDQYKRAHLLNLSVTRVYPEYSDSRYTGASVRCVAQ